MSADQEKVGADFNEYRRLILKELEDGHGIDDKQWQSIRGLDKRANDFNIRLDRLERAEKIKMWVLRALATGVISLFGKMVYDWLSGS